MARIAGTVVGKVQGVGFRWFVVTEAERLGLHGWVLNASDGSVEFEVEGREASIEQFKARIEIGPPAARVERVGYRTPTTAPLPATFEIRRH